MYLNGRAGLVEENPPYLITSICIYAKSVEEGAELDPDHSL